MKKTFETIVGTVIGAAAGIVCTTGVISVVEYCIRLHRAGDVQSGQVWVYKDSSPFSTAECTNTVLQVRSGWVQYRMEWLSSITGDHLDSRRTESVDFFKIGSRRIQ